MKFLPIIVTNTIKFIGNVLLYVTTDHTTVKVLALDNLLRLKDTTKPASPPTTGYVSVAAQNGLFAQFIDAGGLSTVVLPGQALGLMLASGKMGHMTPSAQDAGELEEIGLMKGASQQSGGARTVDADDLRVNYSAADTVNAGIIGAADLFRRDGHHWLQFKFRVVTLGSCRMFIGFTDQTLATMLSTSIPDAGNYIGLAYDGVGTSGTSTATAATTMTDGAATWIASQWIGATFTSGGSDLVCTSNTATVITGSAGWTAGTPATGAYTSTNSPRWRWIRRNGTTRGLTTITTDATTGIFFARILLGVAGTDSVIGFLYDSSFTKIVGNLQSTQLLAATTPTHFMAGIRGVGATRTLDIWSGWLVDEGP